jgi:hypothetical protein
VQQAASELAMSLSRLPLEELDRELGTIRPAWTWELVFDRLPESRQKQLKELWQQWRRERHQQEREWKQRLQTLGGEQIAREYAAALGLKGKLDWIKEPKCPQTGLQFPLVLVHWQKIRFGPFVKRLTKISVSNNGRLYHSEVYFRVRGWPCTLARPRYEQVAPDVWKGIPDGRWEKLGPSRWKWVDGKSRWRIAFDY